MKILVEMQRAYGRWRIERFNSERTLKIYILVSMMLIASWIPYELIGGL